MMLGESLFFMRLCTRLLSANSVFLVFSLLQFTQTHLYYFIPRSQPVAQNMPAGLVERLSSVGPICSNVTNFIPNGGQGMTMNELHFM